VWLLIAAGAAIIASVFIPNIHISNETSTFQQHFVGGGVYAALVFIYIEQLLDWRFHWFAELYVLFACVSALGVSVELAEFTFIHLGVKHINSGDTDWDLLANTLGGFVGYGIIVGACYLKSLFSKGM
jgi:glycopeptide antibiotics resistance protein